MKTILIINTAATSGGALTVLNMYYQKALEDRKNNYIFVISTPELAENTNIKVLSYPNTKKSWIHRLYFDKITINKIIKSVNPDEIVSLQNIYAGSTDIYQKVYIHQSIPFSSHKFSLFKNFKLWIYQNVIGRYIKSSIKKANEVIVQTNWMKIACEQYTKDPNMIKVEPPILKEYSNVGTIDIKKYTSLFYPAGASIYKNHMILLQALKEIKDTQKINVKLYLTLEENQNKLTKKLTKFVNKNDLDVEFVGNLSTEEMKTYYSSNILVFPSYIETVGLPLLEAQQFNSYIISTNEVFSKEILQNYERKEYFKYDNVQSLTKAIIRVLKINKVNFKL